MGKEFVIDNLGDMCALMCDNIAPEDDACNGDCEHCEWVECPLESEE